MLATWLASDSHSTFSTGVKYGTYAVKWVEGTVGMNGIDIPGVTTRVRVWRALPLDPMIITSFVLSMAVNALITGLIVLKILKLFLEVKPTTRGGSGSTTKFRHIIFIIIESGMALFALQMVRVVLSCLPLNTSTVAAFNLMTGINQIFNVITIRSFFLFLFFVLTDNILPGYYY